MLLQTSGLTNVYVTLRSSEELSVRPELKVRGEKEELCCRFIMSVLAVNSSKTFC